MHPSYAPNAPTDLDLLREILRDRCRQAEQAAGRGRDTCANYLIRWDATDGGGVHDAVPSSTGYRPGHRRLVLPADLEQAADAIRAWDPIPNPY